MEYPGCGVSRSSRILQPLLIVGLKVFLILSFVPRQSSAQPESKSGQADAYDEVIRSYQLALEEASLDPSSATAHHLDLLEKLAEAYAAAGRHQQALETFRKYEGLSQEVYDRGAEEGLAEMRARFETEQQQQEIELLSEKQMRADLELARQVNLRRGTLGGFVLVLALLASWVHRARLASRASLMQKNIAQERLISERLREVERLKDEFLANTSHDLRASLHDITSLAESLVVGAGGDLSEKIRSSLSLIVTSSRRLSSLVEDLFDFSKLEHHGVELKLAPVELHALVDVVLTLQEPLVETDALKLRNRIDEGLPPAWGDENRLLQILHNLVGNAIKFTDKGFVEVSAAVVEGRLTVRVTDTGIGIPEEDQERIFQPFEQVDASIERRFGGTGLGLALSRQLVELHGGELEVQSTVAEGSTFTITLPIAENRTVESSAPRPSLVESPKHSGSRLKKDQGSSPSRANTTVTPKSLPPVSDRSTPSGSAEPTISFGRILIVDDERINLQILTDYLSGGQFDLVSVATGEEALELAEKRPFDLVLLDIMMPRISGYQVCKTLRSRHPIDELPIIFLTAKNQDSDIVTGMSLGANDYLTKPISRERLLARVWSHLDLLEAHRRLDRQVKEKMSEVGVLFGLLPICSGCKKVRDDDGYWSQLEMFVSDRSEAQFSHGICPECFEENYADLLDDADIEPSGSAVGRV